MMTNNAPQYRNMMGMPANAKEMQMRMMQNRGPMYVGSDVHRPGNGD